MRSRDIIVKALATSALVVVLDLATKYLVVSRLYLGEEVVVIPGVFNLVYWLNPGAAFGIFGGGGEHNTLILTVISLLALGVVIYLIRHAESGFSVFSLSLIAGGAVGNLIDRVRYGEVVDFLDFYLGSYHWPAFNVADSAISVGVILTIVAFYLLEKERKAKEDQK